MTLTELLEGIKPVRLTGLTDIVISGLSFDSRQVAPGYVFFASSGSAVDGHDYIDKAIENGAVAIVCERRPEICHKGITYIEVLSTNYVLGMMANAWYGFPSRSLTLVGVTGTNGKTTIATLLYQLARGMGHRAGLLSTVCNYVDGAAVAATHTTPDALQLNKLLRQMVDAGCRYAFMEVSSHASDQDRIAGLEFDGAVFTNLTRDHIDYHKTFDNYLRAKQKFFDGLSDEAFAVTNLDDRNGLIMTQNSRARVRTYSTQSAADYMGSIIEQDFDGMLLSLNRREVFVQLVGRFNLSNILAIYATARELGFDNDDTLRVLSSLHSVNGRFQPMRSSKGWTAIIDYAHTPDAVTNVINTINSIRKPGSRLITIVGCGGNRDKGKRPIMAKQAVEGSSLVVLTSDNPRMEDPNQILDDMLQGLSDEQRRQTLVIADRREAIKTACLMAQNNDVVLVAGKGHEDYQIIGTEKHHFDDHEEVSKYL